MGKISTKPQVDQNGQETSNLLVEITYGGLESPFGGIDASAPAAYIDPKCFANADGFLVIDNKLVVVNFQNNNSTQIPTLFNGVSGVSLLGLGSFYNSLNGQLNYAIGYIAAAFIGPPSGVNYTFYITAWNPALPADVYNDTLKITLFDAASILETASITLDCVATNIDAPGAGSGAAGTITSVTSQGQVTGITFTGGSGYGVGDQVPVLQAGSGGLQLWITVLTVGGGGSIATVSILNEGGRYVTGPCYAGTNVIVASGLTLKINSATYEINVSNANFNRQGVIQQMINLINGTPDPNVTASASVDGYSLVLTALVAGTAGNSITVQDTSTSENASLPPPFYFTCRTARNLQGGQISEPSTAPRGFIAPVSTCTVGGTLYIANLGPMILKYSGPGEFTTSTLYNGVGVIRKFAGSMIGLRLENQLGIFTQNQDMILAWSATNNLDEWSPVTNTGNVTGAGFEQIADIGDYLSGLIVSNGTAFIIRSQGVSYATATGNSLLPFDVNHIGLGEQGEGAQVSNLVCQYDQSGAYVGNTDIFLVSNSITSIGAKIKALIFQSLALEPTPSFLTSTGCKVFIGGDGFPLFAFSIGFLGYQNGNIGYNTIFIYNPENGTWMGISVAESNQSETIGPISILLGYLAKQNYFGSAQQYNLSSLALGMQFISEPGGAILTPLMLLFQEGVPNTNSVSYPPFVLFPQEEILLGRDVVVDSLVVSLWANVSENVMLNFYINGTQYDGNGHWLPVSTLFGTLVLTPALFNTLSGNPIECQVFPSGTTGIGVFTAHSPQLQVQVVPITDTGTAQIRISKITEFASFEPGQRPV